MTDTKHGPPVTSPHLRFTPDRMIPLVLVVVGAAALWPYRHFAGDDAYITFRFVRNMANGMGFAFNPGEPTYGSTAPLWVFMLTVLNWAGLSIDGAAHGLNWIFSSTSIWLMWSLARRFVAGTVFQILAVVLLIFDPWAVRWNMSGMENGMALTLMFAAFLSALARRNTGKIDWVTPIWLALATLTRPEMVLLAGVAGLDLVVRERQRLLPDLAALAVVYLFVVSPWLVYAHVTFGSIIPNTISAKVSRNYFLATKGTLKYFASFYALHVVGLLLLVSCRAKVRLRFPSDSVLRSEWLMPLAWGLALPMFYIVGGAPVSGRYLMYGTPCYLLMAMNAWSRVWPRFRAAVVAGLCGTALLIAFIQYRYCWFVTHWPRGMDPRLIEIAEHAKAISKPGAIVACDQIGVMGYFSDLYVLDIIGLVSPEILPHRDASDPNELWRYVHSRHADLIFIAENLNLPSAELPSYRSVQVVRSSPIKREGAGSVGRDLVYTLYKTNW